MYYSDPDSNYVKLQVDNFGDWSKSKEWMKTSPEFAANPIGAFSSIPGLSTTPRVRSLASELHVAITAGQFLPDPTPVIGPPPMKG